MCFLRSRSHRATLVDSIQFIDAAGRIFPSFTKSPQWVQHHADGPSLPRTFCKRATLVANIRNEIHTLCKNHNFPTV